MTTKVEVHANHGWPVDVTPVYPSGTKDTTIRVPAGETRSFYIHSALDLLIHEVQPEEISAETAAASNTQPNEA